MIKLGSKLEVGDVLRVWWNPGHDIIKSLEPYQGPYQRQREFEGARIAEFTIRHLGMTIFSGYPYEMEE